MSFNLRIISPKGLAYEGEVTELNVPLISGPIGILSNHTPYVAILNEKGIASCKEADSQQELFFVVYGGMMDTSQGGNTMLLVEECKKASSLEEAKKLLEEDREITIGENEEDVVNAAIALANQAKE